MANTIETQINTEPISVITGDSNQARYLYYQLKLSMAAAEQIDIIVSFLMESGVKLILDDLKRALDHGAKVRILTGNYLGITQPSALYLLKKGLDDRADIRFYQNRTIELISGSIRIRTNHSIPNRISSIKKTTPNCTSVLLTFREVR